ncbi:imm11 family protein [Candidatus Bodocaedibacter vickermanii]|uniref:Antitoxin with immunity protein 43 domain n=1 Tax=Candidatus Bodocaedibacter vickermanii TaxID=2741701 RepID=A0A7L9RSD1_9PROT|nr:Putative antitoxin with immunity protein 43 domain [Candidatus Paracaedibacteraceae bacterium 'Lake Konstanz']
MQTEIYEFMRVKPLDINYDYNLRFEVLTTMGKIRKYDLVQVNTPHNYLFSPKAIEILTALCPEQIQIFDTLIQCKDGNITEYKAVNILNEVDVSDPEKSKYKYFDSGRVRGYEKYVFHDDCMGRNHIARDTKFHAPIIISPTLKEAFEKAKIKGCKYWGGD